MAENTKLQGTNIASRIVPFDSQDTFPTHEAFYGKGGYRTVEDIAGRDAIPEQRLEEGMLVYCKNDPTGVHTYRYMGMKEGTSVRIWKELRLEGVGIPIYTNSQIKDMEESGVKVDEMDYISIRDDKDLNGNVTNNTYTTTENGTYVDILFKALRALQSEVAKLKNSFLYGIESYNGTDTAISAINEELENAVEEEPLWAVEEDGLSSVYDLFEFNPTTILSEFDLTNGSAKVVEDKSTGYYYIAVEDNGTENNYIRWNSSGSPLNDVTDNKLFMYFVTSADRSSAPYTKEINYVIHLQETYQDETTRNINIDLRELINQYNGSITENGVYNVLVVISRMKKIASTDNDGNTVENYYGKNFIWLSISNPETNTTLKEGYWKNGELYNVGENIYSIDDLIDSSNLDDTSENNRKVLYDGIIDIKSVDFYKTFITKFHVYSRYQDFSREVMPSKPSDQDYKFKAAHITIRSVDTYETLKELKDKLLNNELILVEKGYRLYIKINDKLVAIGSQTSQFSSDNGDEEENTGMSETEIIQWLATNGIIVTNNDDPNLNTLRLNNIEDVTFKHEATGKTFKFTVNENGELESQEIPKTNQTFDYKVAQINNDPTKNLVDDYVRGFVAQVRMAEAGVNPGNSAKDIKLNSDRLKIGAFYAPFYTDLAHGCTHSYVELENTSTVDIPLTGLYLHLTKPVENNNGTGFSQEIFSLPLTGTIPAGGTYLIRGKRHTADNDSNAYIKVSTYDQEWYVGEKNKKELISFEIRNDKIKTNSSLGYGFCITYGNSTFGSDSNSELTPYTQLYYSNDADFKMTDGKNEATYTKKENPYRLNKYLVDSIYYYSDIKNSGNKNYWAYSFAKILPNSLFKNTFELDPAKQAFQAFTKLDSSRARWEKGENQDYQIVKLDSEYISFPHSEDKFPVSNYTPKASWEHKNVCTDKTKLDPDKPNMVTCSFGIDIYKTRCFNWISLGYFDEYVWIKNENANEWTRVSSYLPKLQATVVSKGIVDKGSEVKITLTDDPSNCRIITNTSGELICKLTDDSNFSSISSEPNKYTFITPTENANKLNVGDTIYLLLPNDEADNTNYPRRKCFDANLTNNIYARITGNFPANNSYFTSHKVVVDILSSSDNTVNEGNTSVTYRYKVGRADINGNPDPNHCSDEMTFTIYPDSYTPRIYQVTDQQGFHWVEYQVWAAVAKKVDEKIKQDQANENIIPILMNTGDMTQNGTRINEWYDYYQAGRNLFDHLEQMNCVGNNDLCGTKPFELGTGDDPGKSNAFYFHLFYCYEINPNIPPMCYGANGDNPKYIPSLYYFDTKYNRILVVNSEITATTSKNWYKMGITLNKGTDNEKDLDYNLYTGFYYASDYRKYYTEMNENEISSAAKAKYKPIYDMLYSIISDAQSGGVNKEVMCACHEMPFTVITNNSLMTGQVGVYRSIDNNSKLVGSHLNQIGPGEVGGSGNNAWTGMYWFSRLLEYFGVKLVIGGHKHTYASTYPLRENYFYVNNGKWVNSKDEPMPMSNTLKNDTAIFYGLDYYTRNGDTYTKALSVDNTSFLYIREGDNYKLATEFNNDTTYYRYNGSSYVAQAAGTVSENSFLYMISPNSSSSYIIASCFDKIFVNSETNSSKFPYARRRDPGNSTDTKFYPVKAIPNLTGGVIYFMCQASGYKLTSNKELPSADQKFSMILPETKIVNSNDSASANQKYPMFGIINLSRVNNKTSYWVKLARVTGIMVGTVFNQQNYLTDEMTLQYLKKDLDPNGNIATDYGKWTGSEVYLIENSDWG